jgi:MFS family permease
MFERFKNRSEETNGSGGQTAVAERPETRDEARREATANGETATRRHTTRTADAGGTAVGTREHMHTARARQREEYGGINWGAAFFGWLVAVGLGSLLVAILAAAGAAVGLTQNVTTTDAQSNAETLGLGGAIALIVVLMIAYYAGGYVAGRMSRFDGARQGAGAWIFGIVVTLLLAAAAAILGSEYNVLDQLNLPALPIGSDTMTTGAVIALIAVVAGSVLAAIVGGKAGEHYHRKVDRVGFVD